MEKHTHTHTQHTHKHTKHTHIHLTRILAIYLEREKWGPILHKDDVLSLDEE